MGEYLSAGAHVKEGAESIKLSPGDLFDRVINLKFTRARSFKEVTSYREGELVTVPEKPRTFTVRSDYEPVFHRDGSTSFRRCTQKPAIKVSYKQASNATVTPVDIEVGGLTVIDEEGLDSLLTASRQEGDVLVGDPVVSCEIWMGYRAQFPDWTDPKYRDDIAGYYAMDGDWRFYGRKMTVQILRAYNKSYPPNRVTYFEGIVGTVEAGLRAEDAPPWSYTEDDLPDHKYGDADFPEEFSELEAVLYQFVTRRFIRTSVPHLVETREDEDGVFVQDAYVKGYELYKERLGSDALERIRASYERMGETLPDRPARLVPLNERGLMTIPDANTFGVICILSDTLRRLPATGMLKYGLDKASAQTFRGDRQSPFNTQIDRLGGQLLAIRDHYPFLRWYQMMDGSYYFYHERDRDSDLFIDRYIRQMQETGVIPLPAIYEIVPGGTRTIRCPFYAIVNPMSTVVFQNRFTLGTETSFYYPVRTNAFLVISSEVAFSTTGKDNVMELECVDLPPNAVEVDPLTGQVVTRVLQDTGELSEASRATQEHNKEWTRRTFTVANPPTKTDEVFGLFECIVPKVIWDARWAVMPRGRKTALTEKEVLQAIKSWNGELWAAAKPRGRSYENFEGFIGHRTGIEVPMLEVGDEVVTRFPFQFDYPAGEEVKG